MTKSLKQIVKEILLYQLSDFGGYHIGKLQKKPSFGYNTYYAGFWSSSEKLIDIIVPITRSINKIICDYIDDVCPKGFVDIKKIEVESTYHGDYGENYYNIGITFGGY